MKKTITKAKSDLNKAKRDFADAQTSNALKFLISTNYRKNQFSKHKKAMVKATTDLKKTKKDYTDNQASYDTQFEEFNEAR